MFQYSYDTNENNINIFKMNIHDLEIDGIENVSYKCKKCDLSFDNGKTTHKESLYNMACPTCDANFYFDKEKVTNKYIYNFLNISY